MQVWFNSYCVPDTSDQSIKIIRRSARWKKGARSKRNSTSPDSAQSDSVSPDLSKSSSSSPDPVCRIFCHSPEGPGEKP